MKNFKESKKRSASYVFIQMINKKPHLVLMMTLFSMTFFLNFYSRASFSQINEVSKKYREAALIEMEVEKEIVSEMIGKESKYKGKMALSSNLFRWDCLEPEKSLIVFDGTFFWSVQYPSEDFPGAIQVVKARLNKKNKQQLFMVNLLKKKKIKEYFKMKKENLLEDKIVYDFEPTNKEFNISSLRIEVDLKEKTFSLISYQDDVGNKTTMRFSSIKFLDKSNKKLFKYVPEKGAEISTLD